VIGSAVVAARRSSHKKVRAMCAISSMPVSGLLSMMDPDHGSVGVEGYRHADLTLVHAMGRGQLAMVDQSVPVVAKMAECAV
jgi:hypothetical protein